MNALIKKLTVLSSVMALFACDSQVTANDLEIIYNDVYPPTININNIGSSLMEVGAFNINGSSDPACTVRPYTDSKNNGFDYSLYPDDYVEAVGEGGEEPTKISLEVGEGLFYMFQQCKAATRIVKLQIEVNGETRTYEFNRQAVY